LVVIFGFCPFSLSLSLSLSLSSLSFSLTRVWTQGLKLAKQVIGHLNKPQSFCFPLICFSDSLDNFCTGLRHQSSCLQLLGSWEYRYVSPCWALDVFCFGKWFFVFGWLEWLELFSPTHCGKIYKYHPPTLFGSVKDQIQQVLYHWVL
jgi:hypothetical protein